MSNRGFSLLTLLLVSLWPLSTTYAADEPVKLKSQSIKIAPARAMPVSFEMVQLPPGKITLKDKKGVEHEYAIKPIWIAKTESTWDVYDIFWMRLDLKSPWDRVQGDAKSRPSKPYFPPDRGWGHEGYPAMTLTLQSAQLYCDWLSNQTGKKFRIPTEAEWEYACRAGGPSIKPDAKQLELIAWYDKNSNDQTHAVGRKRPNAWGLYDTLGNVAEWVTCSDGTSVVAGGSFADEADEISSAHREPYSPAWQRSDPQDPKGRSWLSNGTHVGLRVVMEDADEKSPANPLAPKSK